jgi:23S rRNA pseudouridine1911/1915/1917 synthase
MTLTVPPDADGRLDAWLASQVSDLSRSRIQTLMLQGWITCQGEPVEADDAVKPGQEIEVTIPPPLPSLPQPEEIPLRIVYEDDDLLVIDKAPGIVVHPAPGHEAGTLVNALLHHCQDMTEIGGVQRPGIVHRLDKDTSGLMVVAKSDAAMVGLAEAFQTGKVRKIYMTLVHGAPSLLSGTIQTLMARHPCKRKKMAIVEQRGKMAITHYEVLETYLTTSLIRCRIETGRTHQIRVHMTHLGCPVVGDDAYGRHTADMKLLIQPARQMLHAAQLGFPHPVTQVSLAFESPLPSDFVTMIQDGVQKK